jgi:hypothetical protein
MFVDEGQYFVWVNSIYSAVEAQEIDENGFEGDVREILQFDVFSTFAEREAVAEALNVVNPEEVENGDFDDFDGEENQIIYGNDDDDED